MPDVICPKCRVKRSIDDQTYSSYVGKPVKCGQCKTSFTLDPPTLSTFQAQEQPVRSRTDDYASKVAWKVAWIIGKVVLWGFGLLMLFGEWITISRTQTPASGWMVLFQGVIAGATVHGLFLLRRIAAAVEKSAE